VTVHSIDSSRPVERTSPSRRARRCAPARRPAARSCRTRMGPPVKPTGTRALDASAQISAFGRLKLAICAQLSVIVTVIVIFTRGQCRTRGHGSRRRLLTMRAERVITSAVAPGGGRVRDRLRLRQPQPADQRDLEPGRGSRANHCCLQWNNGVVAP
jgi:hypothetical protein